MKRNIDKKKKQGTCQFKGSVRIATVSGGVEAIDLT